MSRLERIWLKRMARGPMDPVVEATLVAGRGLAGNANQRGLRQVTIITAERWHDLMDRLGAAVDPSARRANLMVSGIELMHSRGRVLRIGSCRLQVHGEARPCERMDEALPGLRTAMAHQWSGGVYCEVLDDGVIRIGDAVAWEALQRVSKEAAAGAGAAGE